MNPSETGANHEYSSKSFDELKVVFADLGRQVLESRSRLSGDQQISSAQMYDDWVTDFADLNGVFENPEDPRRIFEVRAKMIALKVQTQALLDLMQIESYESDIGGGGKYIM
jgi:hypothetical protein